LKRPSGDNYPDGRWRLAGSFEAAASRANQEGIMSKKPSTRVLAFFAFLVLATAIPATTRAGLLRVQEAEPGSVVTVTWTDLTTPETVTANKKGVAQFGLGTVAEEKTIDVVSVTKLPEGQKIAIQYEIKLKPGEVTLASLEPFNIPTFTSATTSLVAVVDPAVLVASGDPFTAGELLTVTNGSVTESTAITFKDGGNLSSGEILTDSQIEALPNYTGSATVLGFDSLQSIPEPSSLIMAATAVVIGLGCYWRRGRRAPNSRHD
jgi:hypothetical protein